MKWSMNTPSERAAAVQLDYLTAVLKAFEFGLQNDRSVSLINYATCHNARLDYAHEYRIDDKRYMIETSIEIKTRYREVEE